MTEDELQTHREELNHEAGHAVAQALAGAAFSRITHHEPDADHSSPYMMCTGYTVERSGPQPMDDEHSDLTTMGGPMATLIFDNDTLTFSQKLQICPIYLKVIGESGRCKYDWEALGKELTHGTTRAAMKMSMVFIRHYEPFRALVDQKLPDFVTGEPITLISEELRQIFGQDSMPDQMMRVLPYVFKDPDSVSGITQSLLHDPAMISAPKPQHLIAPGPVTVERAD